MPTAVATAVDTFIRAWSERDPAVRAAMVDACFAADGRLVARQSEIRGRAALVEAMTRVNADPEIVRIRLVSVVDASGTTFRYRAVVDRRDGTTSPESFDAGEIDADGRIRLVLTFAGPLLDADTER